MYEIKLNKLTEQESTQEMIVKMAEGNPGAVALLCEVVRAGQIMPSMLDIISICDSLEIYGSRLYMLWNDCFGRDLMQMNNMLTSCLMSGMITAEQVISHIDDHNGRGISFDDIIRN